MRVFWPTAAGEAIPQTRCEQDGQRASLARRRIRAHDDTPGSRCEAGAIA